MLQPTLNARDTIQKLMILIDYSCAIFILVVKDNSSD